MSTQIEQPVILITGGSQGLGFALAKQLLKHGFAVSICARTDETLATAEAQLKAYGPVFAMRGNICDDSFRSRYVKATVHTFGRLDAVVNNASTLGTTPLPDVLKSPLDNLRDVMETNVVAPVAIIQEAMPYLLKQTPCLIVGISSDAAAGGYAGWGIYGASKAALDLLHKSLAAEVDGQGVQVFSVDPGDMDTAMHKAADPGAKGLPKPEQVAIQLVDLFRPLIDEKDAGFAFSSGSRLVVQEFGLKEVE